MSASRKVKVPECSMEELMEFYKAKQPFPWHWGNSIYLEWFSVTNGRVVIEAAHYQLELDVEPVWILTETEEAAQQAANAEAMAAFMKRVCMQVPGAKVEDEDDDQPQSLEEALADAEDARRRKNGRAGTRMRRSGILWWRRAATLPWSSTARSVMADRSRRTRRKSIRCGKSYSA
jgi:hypothetical protein